ncbi:hypothetical protein SLEP1_g59784, partial [Rubroshorea leprosula]
MDPITFTKLSHLWDVLLINRNNQAIPIEKALSLVLNKNLKSIKGWTLETIQNCWLNPILTMKGVDPTPFLPPPMEGIPLPLEHLSPDSWILRKAVWSSLAEIVKWDDWMHEDSAFGGHKGGSAELYALVPANYAALLLPRSQYDGSEQGRAANQEFKRNAMDIINQHNPVDSDGFAGGIWLMWDDTKYTIDILNVGPQAIHANVLVRSKLARWKANMLSLVGRVTFVTSVLSSIPNYYMQGMFFPASIHKELDTISRNFIWGSTSTKRKANLISWDRITQPRKAGGIGIRASSEVNQAAMAKLHWRMITEVQKPWAKAFISKYKIDPPYHNFSQSSSPICKDISKGKDIVEKGISWVPRDGSKINFWQDRWILKESLCSVFYGPFRPHDLDITVKDLLFPDGKWNFDAVAYPLPQDIIQKIVAIAFQRHSAEQDSFRCPRCRNGLETLTHIFRECQYAALFWNSIIPQSISTYNQNLDFKSWIKFGPSGEPKSLGSKEPSSRVRDEPRSWVCDIYEIFGHKFVSVQAIVHHHELIVVVPIKPLLIPYVLQRHVPQLHPRLQHLQHLLVNPSGVVNDKMGSLSEQSHMGSSISMPELATTTKNFSSDLIIGDSSFELVDKTTLSNSVTIAIKKLNRYTFHGLHELWVKMEMLGKLRHQNMVKILGYCLMGLIGTCHAAI